MQQNVTINRAENVKWHIYWCILCPLYSLFSIYGGLSNKNWRFESEWRRQSFERIRYETTGPLPATSKLRVAHAPGMPVTFSPPTWINDPYMYHSACVTHVPWCMPGSLTSGLHWIRWQGKRSRHSWRMRNPQIYVSGKSPIAKAFVFKAAIKKSDWTYRSQHK